MLNVNITLNGEKRNDLVDDLVMSAVYMLYSDPESVWNIDVKGTKYFVDSVLKEDNTITINLVK